MSVHSLMHSFLSQLHGRKCTSADPTRSSSICSHKRKFWGCSGLGSQLRLTASCTAPHGWRLFQQSHMAEVHSSSLMTYHHATLKPSQPNRGLPNPSKVLLLKPQSWLCQDMRSTNPRCLRSQHSTRHISRVCGGSTETMEQTHVN